MKIQRPRAENYPREDVPIGANDSGLFFSRIIVRAAAAAGVSRKRNSLGPPTLTEHLLPANLRPESTTAPRQTPLLRRTSPEEPQVATSPNSGRRHFIGVTIRVAGRAAEAQVR